MIISIGLYFVVGFTLMGLNKSHTNNFSIKYFSLLEENERYTIKVLMLRW